MKEGFVQVYTGDGKGKTTAALGLSLRALGRGLRVIFIQFLKGAPSGELQAAAVFGDRFKIIRLAETESFFGTLDEEEKAALAQKLREELSLVRQILAGAQCDLLVLDEIMSPIHGGLIAVEEVCALIAARPANMELVLTGRGAPPEILERADLVTEMRCLRHYFARGVPAREGIEM